MVEWPSPFFSGCRLNTMQWHNNKAYLQYSGDAVSMSYHKSIRQTCLHRLPCRLHSNIHFVAKKSHNTHIFTHIHIHLVAQNFNKQWRECTYNNRDVNKTPTSKINRKATSLKKKKLKNLKWPNYATSNTSQSIIILSTFEAYYR